jgi:hypothetical protein
MKKWLITVILAFVLSIGGIGESQTPSQFPKPNKSDAIGVEFANCDDVIFSIVGYTKDNDLKYYVYEVGNTVFAVIEFVPGSDQSIAIYTLQQNGTVLKYVPNEYSQLASPCKTIKALNLKNERNKF